MSRLVAKAQERPWTSQGFYHEKLGRTKPEWPFSYAIRRLPHRALYSLSRHGGLRASGKSIGTTKWVWPNRWARPESQKRRIWVLRSYTRVIRSWPFDFPEPQEGERVFSVQEGRWVPDEMQMPFGTSLQPSLLDMGAE